MIGTLEGTGCCAVEDPDLHCGGFWVGYSWGSWLGPWRVLVGVLLRILIDPQLGMLKILIGTLEDIKWGTVENPDWHPWGYWDGYCWGSWLGSWGILSGMLLRIFIGTLVSTSGACWGPKFIIGCGIVEDPDLDPGGYWMVVIEDRGLDPEDYSMGYMYFKIFLETFTTCINLFLSVFKIIGIEENGFKEKANLRVGRINLNFSITDVQWHPQEGKSVYINCILYFSCAKIQNIHWSI